MQPSMSAFAEYRSTRFNPQIQGLRAIAVLGVVFYHFGATWLPGGFIGVDVFFVISGFLISGQIYRELDRNQFSILRFYERRARRILPAYLCTTLIASIAACLLLLPTQLTAYANSVIASLAFVSNIYFYATSGYFAPKAVDLPLLHYWSLGLEEQFYLFFPPLMIAIHQFPKGRAASVILITLTSLSLLAAEIILRRNPDAAFYLLPFRAFEFLLGALLARYETPPTTDSFKAIFAILAGVLIILIGMVSIDEQSRFPGITALVPCAGTLAAIWGASSADGRRRTPLASRPMLFFGNISYSLYLVHWPIVVFGKLVAPDLDPVAFWFAGVGLSIALAWFSYRFIERPSRGNTPFKFFAIPAVALFAVLVGGAGMTVSANGFPARFDSQINRISAYSRYDYAAMFREGTCFLRPEQKAEEIDFEKCVPLQKSIAVVWGSSTLAHLYWGLKPVFEKHGYALGQLTASSCTAIIGIDIPERPNCRFFNDLILSKILHIKPDMVLIGGDAITDPIKQKQMEQTIDQLSDNGIKVIMLGPWPIYKTTVPAILIKRISSGDAGTKSAEDMQASSVLHDEVMTTRFAKNERIKYVSILGTVCPKNNCPLVANGNLLNFDVIHLTREGSIFYGKLLEPLLFP